LALTFLAARIGTVARPRTEAVAALRFGLYFVQVVCFVSRCTPGKDSKAAVHPDVAH